MPSTDVVFAGSIPGLYDRYLVPMLFAPYAEDLAARVAAESPRDIVETAAGTGAVTERLARALPEARIVATDLNQAMLDVAAQRVAASNVTFQAADAQALPFADESADAIVCQFGVMFFPERVDAYREARRVLRPGGRFLFNAWDSLDANPGSRAVSEAARPYIAPDLGSFMERVPFGYHDTARIEDDLRAAGFTRIARETVAKRSRSASARDAAIGLVQGTPLRAQIEAHDPAGLEPATDAVAAALASFEGPDGLDAPMSAHVFVATR
ncbi:MAG: class I SAM-dependent methyltransferase [Sphingosinicella sp.]|uniref:class I SAM-dependent methyltransferase n=1 Tax=Sphingosinicella sp. TaxID=1917971 RepID=UPI0040377E56